MKQFVWSPNRRVLAVISVFVFSFVLGFFAAKIVSVETSASALANSGYETGNMRLAIPSIGLTTPVTELEIEGKTLVAPETIVGRYRAGGNKDFLIGHLSSVFRELHEVKIGEKVIFNEREYRVVKTEVQAREEIDMAEILEPTEEPTLVIMTCHGQPITETNYSHRFIVWAEMEED